MERECDGTQKKSKTVEKEEKWGVRFKILTKLTCVLRISSFAITMIDLLWLCLVLKWWTSCCCYHGKVTAWLACHHWLNSLKYILHPSTQQAYVDKFSLPIPTRMCGPWYSINCCLIILVCTYLIYAVIVHRLLKALNICYFAS